MRLLGFIYCLERNGQLQVTCLLLMSLCHMCTVLNFRLIRKFRSCTIEVQMATQINFVDILNTNKHNSDELPHAEDDC